MSICVCVFCGVSVASFLFLFIFVYIFIFISFLSFEVSDWIAVQVFGVVEERDHCTPHACMHAL